MKKLIYFAAIFICLSLADHTNAQVGVSFNIGQQPVWGPVGYDYVEYYYIPDLGVYYNVPTHQYTYFEDNKWVTTNELPARYGNVDLYGAHKVVINQANPWLRDPEYRVQYAPYKGRHDQQAIRDSHEEKYWENPNHPEHSKWHKQENRH